MEWLIIISAALLIASKFPQKQIPETVPTPIIENYQEPYQGQDSPGDVLLVQAPTGNETIDNGGDNMDLLTLGALGAAAYLGYKALNKESTPPATNSYISPVEQIPGSTGTPVINDPYAPEPPDVDTTSNFDPSTVLPQGGVTVGQIFGENPPPQIVTYQADLVEQGGGGYNGQFVRQMVDWGQWDASVLDHNFYWSKYWAELRGESAYSTYGGVQAYLQMLHEQLFGTPYMGD